MKKIILGTFLAILGINVQAMDQFLIHYLNPADRADLMQEEEVFINAYTQMYQDIPLEDLGIDNLHDYLVEAFAQEQADLQDPLIYAIKVTVNNQVIGFASFESANFHDVYIRHLVVDPAWWDQNVEIIVIRTLWHQFIPFARKLVVALRKVNTIGIDLYESLGFSVSQQLPAGLDPAVYVAYQLEV
jgi:ribosomal protein S18 acetylase RimI-like enzyme